MRLTVNLEDDLYALAKAVARAEDCSLSAAVNRLLRRVVEPIGTTSPSGRSAIPLVRCRARFTSEDVERFEVTDEG